MVSLHGLPSRLKTLARNKSSLRGQAQDDKSTPVLVLKVKVVRARDLAAKDRTGKSDPYLILRFNDTKSSTKVISSDLNPVWNEVKDFPLHHDSHSYRLEAVAYDWDRFSTKDYLGEFGCNLKTHFAHHSASASLAKPLWFPLRSFRSGRKSSNVSGDVELVVWLEDPANPDASEDHLQVIWRQFASEIEQSPITAIANAPPDMPVGMRRTEDVDAVMTLDDSADEDDDENDMLDRLDSDIESRSDVEDCDEVPTGASAESQGRRRRLRRRRKRRSAPFQFTSSSATDTLGLVFLEIVSASDLPREKNLTKTGFDMDPFVVTSFSKKVFRTRVVRHSLNPVFNDKVLFQVHRHENQFSLQFNVVDRDKLSGNDMVGSCQLQIADLIAQGPIADSETGLYKLTEIEAPSTGGKKKKQTSVPRIGHLKRQDTASSIASTASSTELENGAQNISLADNLASGASAPIDDKMLKLYDLPLLLAGKSPEDAKASSRLQVKAKFVPYPALRQQFWRTMLKHYDTDETGTISKIELTTMLDSLGATLKESRIDAFFEKTAQLIDENAQPVVDNESRSVDQCVAWLEAQLLKGFAKAPASDSPAGTAGKPPSRPPSRSSMRGLSSMSVLSAKKAHSTPSAQTTSSPSSNSSKPPSIVTNDKPPSEDTLAASEEDGVEYLISISQCPICNKSHMAKKSAIDIVTHLATCASQDWRKVDHLVMGDFVTPSQASRKWYTKIITKVGYGGYRLGANSANILVQDRRTGQIQEERMSVYVRLGIRLLYKGMKSSRMESYRIRKLLKSMSIKQGVKYDSPNSAKDIAAFIAFHQLDMTEVLDPIESFANFNEFFYRKLKPDARPCAAPGDPRVAVSPADCRSVVFNTLTAATEIWVKGQQFGVKRLFREAYPDLVGKFDRGALGIFRLAPQDYHRFHVPVDGVVGEPRTIEGQYYTVNPMAIRSNLDVYGENVRILVPIESPQFGTVMCVCVGAMMVGSTVITAKTGAQVKRGDELGYFKFGGSTVLLLFQPGKLQFDEDLRQNADAAIETLLRVGSSIGHPPGMPDAPSEADVRDKLQNAPKEVQEREKAAAQQRIGGGSVPAPQDANAAFAGEENGSNAASALKHPVQAVKDAKDALMPAHVS